MAIYKPYIKKENGSISELPLEANKVANPITIKLNGGTTEGTNQYTFDGSKPITTNITPSSIGLGNVDNTSDADKPISKATQQAIDEINNELENHIVECNCTHEVEITGFGEEDCNLAIDDQDVVITKIQGQTRRKSLNLLNPSWINSEYAIYNPSDNSYSLGATSNGVICDNLDSKITNKGHYVLSFMIKAEESGKEPYIVVRYINTDGNIAWKTTNDVTTTNYIECKLDFYGIPERIYLTYANISGAAVIKDIMVNEGSTALPYEPFDDTLVNSKCDFVSTGRNLLNIKDSAENTINGIKYSIKDGIVSLDGTSTSGYTDIYLFGSSTDNGEYLHIPKGSYSMNLFKNGIPSGISLFMREKTQGTAYSNNDILKMLEKNDCYFYGILVRVGTEGQTLTCSNATMRPMIVNGSKVPTVFEPYIEDTMQCGLELGKWDWHDNVNHITHIQTRHLKSKNYLSHDIITNAAGNPYVQIGDTTVYSINDIICNCNKVDQGSWWQQTFNDVTLTIDDNSKNLVIMLPNGAIDTSALNNNIDIIYKLATEITVTNVLPSGYKVWYKGMQTQKTETIPYILTKQYGISLASQVLNNVSVDRSQQKQIDEIKKEINNIYEEKANSIQLSDLINEFSVSIGSIDHTTDSIKINPNSSYARIRFKINKVLTVGKKYTFSVNVSRSRTISILHTNTDLYDGIIDNSATKLYYQNQGKPSGTITTSFEAKTANLYLGVYINGNWTNTEVCEISNLFLTEYVDQYAKDPKYLPYNASKNISNSEALFLKTEAEKSANLLPPSCFYPNNNIQSDGSLGTYPNYSCYYKVPVKPNTTYIASRNGGIISNDLGVAMYDSNGTFLKYIVWSGSKGTTENNVYFISFDFPSSYTNIMLNEGPVALPYQPYEGKVIHEKDLENLPKLYNHSVLVTITYSGTTYQCRVNILSSQVNAITSLDTFTTICANAKNISKNTTTVNDETKSFYSMPAEGIPSSLATSDSQYNMIFKLRYIIYPASSGGVKYIYMHGIGNSGSIISAYATSATFSDTVTTIYGGV